MKNVLIVDDDTIVRITLHALVKWEDLGYRIVADAIHGEQALQCLKEQKIDLVITDMKMPVMDGIEFLKEMNRLKRMPKVLVLSGYDDFTLVRDAFRLGACDYLLKADLNEELMTSMLERLNQEGWETGIGESDSGELEKESALLKEEVFGGRQLVDMAMGRREVGTSFPEGEYLAVQFEIEDFLHHAGRFDGNLEDQLIKPMLEFANQIPRVVAHCVLGSISPSRYVMLYQVNDKNQYMGNVVSTCRQLCRVWNNYMNLQVSAGISSLGEDGSAFLERFEEAGNQLRLRYLKGRAKICYPWEKETVTFSQVQKAGDIYKKLLHGLLAGDELVVNEEKKLLFEEFYQNGLEAAKERCLHLICHLAWILQDSHDDISSLFADEVDYYEKIGRLPEMRNLELWVNNYFRWIMDYAQNHQDRKQTDQMLRAKRFIMDNYANPELTLGSVAGYIGLNEKYFSSRFTKEEGTTFSNYLTEVRIRKARELMDKTDLKMYEISQQVGYNNVEHFTRVFKKVCRVSPGGYRKGGN